MSQPNRIAVTKHENKIRLHLELPVGGEDPSLIRIHDVDIPLVHALALAAGILNEATGLMRHLQPTRPLNEEQRAKLAADRRATLESMAADHKADRAAEREALRLMLDSKVSEQESAEPGAGEEKKPDADQTAQ